MATAARRTTQRIAAALLVCCLLGALTAPPASASRFRLGTEMAVGFMETALLRHPSLNFGSAGGQVVKCNKRISDIRVRCRMSWFLGDLSYSGRGTIWITFPEGRPFWNYSYRVVRFNEYCAVLEGPDCTKTYVVR
jgi:hypothetical protein